MAFSLWSFSQLELGGSDAELRYSGHFDNN